ncbi:MAG: TIGR01244 family phosphatase [Betaproteobacteria bacterium]|nr:TIGR01244 family phosphatase [Betaproteobacteria bacterium]NBY04075.1 TIGR01244 family phosphatase [Betaproteobacteria bacterium]
MSLPVTHHSEQFATIGQLMPEDMAAVAAMGFQSVINNRPDGEGGPDQPTSDQMAQAAQAAGLTYAFLPVIAGMITPEQARAFAQWLGQQSGPVLAFCRSGARSTQLREMARAYE